MPSLCGALKQEYEQLKTLTEEFAFACAKGKQEGNFQRLSAQELRTLQYLKQRVETARDALKEKLFVSIEAAEKIIGKENVFGPEAIETAFGIRSEQIEVPPIRFSQQELKEAKERGEYLILRVGTLSDGTPLTIKTIAERVQPVLTKYGLGKALRFDSSAYEGQSLFTDETFRSGWALVSKQILPDSTRKNCRGLIHIAAKEMESICSKDPSSKYSVECRHALEEYNSALPIMEKLVQDGKWTEMEEFNSQLSINQLARHTAPEAFFDAMLVRATAKGDDFLSHWVTNTISSLNGNLAFVGFANKRGARVEEWRHELSLDAEGFYEVAGLLLSRRR